MGKLIVIEGIDGTGKTTQFERLCALLREKSIPHRELSFPCYDDPSSTLVRMYLGGSFGTAPDAVNAYAASAFFACDRYASFKQHWEQDYNDGMLFVSCRYTTSNAIHQGAKLAGDDRRAYLDWLFDYEYRLLGIPAPDRVLLLDCPAEVSTANLRKREASGASTADIHETDTSYLARCAVAAGEAADRFGWQRIPCASDGTMRSPDDIHADICAALSDIIGIL